MTRKKSTMKGYTRVEVQRNLVSLLKGSSGVYQESISQSVFECRRKTARQRRASPFLSPPANVVLRFCFFLLRRRSEYTITWKCLASTNHGGVYVYTIYIYISFSRLIILFLLISRLSNNNCNFSTKLEFFNSIIIKWISIYP